MHATLAFNVGGLIGILLSIPIAKRLGRRVDVRDLLRAFVARDFYRVRRRRSTVLARLLSYVVVGIGVYGVAGVFAFYLPELFPTRVRASGSGFCYNIGRIVAAPGSLHRRRDRSGRQRGRGDLLCRLHSAAGLVAAAVHHRNEGALGRSHDIGERTASSQVGHNGDVDTAMGVTHAARLVTFHACHGTRSSFRELLHGHTGANEERRRLV